MDAVVISSLTGIAGLAIGVIGTVFVFGRRYESLLTHDREMSQALEAVKEDIKKHKEEEGIVVKELTQIISACKDEMSNLSKEVAVLNNTLENRPQQKDIQDITNRLASIEAKIDRNGKEGKR